MIKAITCLVCDKCGHFTQDVMSDDWKPLLDDLGCPRCREYAMTLIAQGRTPELYPPDGIPKFCTCKIDATVLTKVINGTHC